MKPFNHWLGLLAGMLLLAACAAPTPTPLPTATTAPTQPPEATSTSLPTAVPPDSVGSWGITFQHTFPPEHWSTGIHQYGFLMSCPFLGQMQAGTQWLQLKVSEQAPLRDQPVYLRLAGLSTSALDPINIEAIHPAQETIAALTVVGISEEDAFKAFESDDCQVVMRWDQKGTEMLQPLEPFEP